ncbi:hypothetical protein BCR39DRAFT_386592 [Naematelia encephala]|uniref:Uncharacterized protein n=1 Tax=Naematelia encephala TaxID=71784 RepID=A0A1Y2AIK9_9TREE|nr:hypothetical protein BCR39DRAFT_386592 [Naematelia encephala]
MEADQQEPSRLESPQSQRIADFSAQANGSSTASSVLNERFVASVHDTTVDQVLSDPQTLRDQLAMDRAQSRSDLNDLEDKLALRDFELQALQDSNSALQDSCTALRQRVVDAERSERASARVVERWERVMLELVPDRLLGGSRKWRPEEVAEVIRSTLR